MSRLVEVAGRAHGPPLASARRAPARRTPPRGRRRAGSASRRRPRRGGGRRSPSCRRNFARCASRVIGLAGLPYMWAIATSWRRPSREEHGHRHGAERVRIGVVVHVHLEAPRQRVRRRVGERGRPEVVELHARRAAARAPRRRRRRAARSRARADRSIGRPTRCRTSGGTIAVTRSTSAAANPIRRRRSRSPSTMPWVARPLGNGLCDSSAMRQTRPSDSVMAAASYAPSKSR